MKIKELLVLAGQGDTTGVIILTKSVAVRATGGDIKKIERPLRVFMIDVDAHCPGCVCFEGIVGWWSAENI